MKSSAVALIPRVHHAVRRRIRRFFKMVYQATRLRTSEPKKVLFIVGCQRSGTRLIQRLFDANFDCRTFGEFSELSSADKRYGIRLNPLPDVAAVINNTPVSFVVVRPLVETQNVRALLDYFPGSRALFMYRRYADVAASDIVTFGPRNAIDNNVCPIAEADPENWRSAGAGQDIVELARRSYSKDMTPNDAAVLFWLARNQLFFDLDLPNHPAVMLCRYEHLTEDPVAVMRRAYAFVGVDCPDLSCTAEVRPPAAPKSLELSEHLRARCEQLQARLDAHYEMDSRSNRPG